FKYIYLTGHMMFWTTTIFAGVLVQVNENISYWPLVIFLSVVMGLYWTLHPAVVQPHMREVAGNDNIALGHRSEAAVHLPALAGKLCDKKDRDAEKINVTNDLEFLRASKVITALTMKILFVIGAIVVMLRDTHSAQQLGAPTGQNFLVYAIIQSLTFTEGIA